MNPDGTGQYGVLWQRLVSPNARLFARAIPGHPTQIVGIVTGHHEGRVGELVIFDPARGRRETEGVVQRIPGCGQPVEPIIEDKLTEHSWPKFLHPDPLSDKYFLVAGKPEPDSLLGIYLVDVLDNHVLVRGARRLRLAEPGTFPIHAHASGYSGQSATGPDQRGGVPARYLSGAGFARRPARIHQKPASVYLSLRLPPGRGH